MTYRAFKMLSLKFPSILFYEYICLLLEKIRSKSTHSLLKRVLDEFRSNLLDNLLKRSNPIKLTFRTPVFRCSGFSEQIFHNKAFVKATLGLSYLIKISTAVNNKNN